jgi:predicted nucleic acid-binding Zn ribbon protein
LEDAWREAAGEMMAEYSQPGSIRRGVLEVIVASSTLRQELVFRKQVLIESLKQRLPDEGIRDLKFRVGAVN